MPSSSWSRPVSRRQLADREHHRSVEAEQVEPQPAHLVGQRLLVQHAQDGVLAVNAGHHADTEIDGPVLEQELEATVLRNSALGDVELGHNLDTRQHRVGEFDTARPRRLRQHAVEPVLDDQPLGLGLEKDIAGTRLQRVVEGRVDELDGVGLSSSLMLCGDTRAMPWAGPCTVPCASGSIVSSARA